MTRLIKLKRAASKKGFTLLEVILSVAIMLVLTTMMMNGFAATMSYSYHTSVYASTASSNYKTALTNVGKNSSEGRSAYTHMGKGYTGVSDTSLKKIKFDQVISGATGQEISIQLYRENGGASSAKSHGYRDQVEQYGDAADGTYSNNRTAFYYLPKYIRNGTIEATRGKIYILKDGSEYWWYDTVNKVKVFKAY